MSKVMKIFFVIAYISFLGFLLSDGWAVEYNAFLGIPIISYIWYKLVKKIGPKTKQDLFNEEWDLLLEVSIKKNDLNPPKGFTTTEIVRYDWFISNWKNMNKVQQDLILSFCGFNNGLDENDIPYFSKFDKLRRKWGSAEIGNLVDYNTKKINLWILANWNLFNKNQKKILREYGLIENPAAKKPVCLYTEYSHWIQADESWTEEEEGWFGTRSNFYKYDKHDEPEWN